MINSEMEHSWRQEGNILLRDDERIDDLQRNQYGNNQRKNTISFGIDAEQLYAFAVVKPGEKALDLGTGTGIIPILLEAKTEGRHFTGLEIQEESADMARRSVKYNHLEEKVEIVTGDIKEAGSRFALASFDVGTSNPPYMNDAHGIKNPGDAKAIARHEELCTLHDVVSQAAGLLMPGGRFFMVLRPFRLAEIMTELCGCGLEPKRMRHAYPFVDREPNMVLIEEKKGGKSRITVEKPMIIYKEPGKYTDEIYEVYGY